MRQQEEVFYRRDSIDYIEGNTVRKMEAAPQRRGEQVRRELEQKQQHDRILEQRHREALHAARRNQQKALRMSPGYVLFLAAAMFLMVGICAIYLQLQSEIGVRMKNIASLESQVIDLRTDNDATLKRINTTVNMESIKNTAMNELGMVYPAKDQIVHFQIDTADYMNQYEDIPNR